MMRERVQNMTLAEARAACFPSIEGYAATWDRDVTSVTGRNAARTWASNPVVLVIELERFDRPLSSEVALNTRPMVAA